MRWSGARARAVAAVRARPRAAVGAALALVLVCAATGWRLTHRSAADAGSPSENISLVRPVRGPAPRPDRVVTFAEGCMTSRCHASFADAPVKHAPSAHGACEACHAPDAGDHKYPLLAARGEVCSSCHDTGGHQTFQHKAMSEDSCLACHDPHASRTGALLKGASMPQTCAQCHPATQGRVRHAPYASDRCDECHDPHGADNRSLLVNGTGADACRPCHAAVARAVDTAPHAHRKVDRSCLACHAPHASGQKGLLTAPTRELCISCHEDIGRAVSGATVSHDPVLKDHQCVTCHDPHASGNPSMLRDTQAQVCLSCHDKPVVAADGRKIPEMSSTLAHAPAVHGAVRLGNCSDCHSVHGGTHAKLLRETNSKVLMDAYDARNYALCFSCHDKNLAESGASTAFRDGNRNLHEAHLRSGEKSRSCAACHAAHSSDLPRLMARSVNFEGSGWQMPMNFQLTADGGKCGPGCHEPLEYSRRPGGVRTVKNGGAP